MDDLFYLKELYQPLEEVIPALNLGHEGIRYYANSVTKSDIFNLARRSDEDRYVHAISFIAHQYYCLQDNLADVLLTVVQSHPGKEIISFRIKAISLPSMSTVFLMNAFSKMVNAPLVKLFMDTNNIFICLAFIKCY
jgi:hypothetical protein